MKRHKETIIEIPPRDPVKRAAFEKAMQAHAEIERKAQERERKRLAKLCTCCPVHGPGFKIRG